ncbi:telomerase protein component 1, partial [Silurus asotus]
LKILSLELLQRYGEALDKAVQISCKHNIPPLSGHTLIFFMSFTSTTGVKGADFCLPPETLDENMENTNLSPTLMEVSLLLAMMIRFCSEHTQFVLADSEGLQEIQVESGGLLENVRRVVKLIEVDNIIFMADYMSDYVPAMMSVERFQKACSREPLLVNILLNQ